MPARAPADGGSPPDDQALTRTLAGARILWDELIRYVETEYAPVTRRWAASKTSALGFLRLVRKGRTILYLLPGEAQFLAAFVFGEKAAAAVRASDVPAAVMTALNEARPYAEGRGIRLPVRGRRDLATMKKLAAIKMAG